MIRIEEILNFFWFSSVIKIRNRKILAHSSIGYSKEVILLKSSKSTFI